MTHTRDPKNNISELRRRAESAFTEKPREPLDLSVLSPEDAERLIHELQVHQMELEIQNEDLNQAQLAMEESRDKYADLYDFAPVGYLTLNAKGLILEANLTAVRLLGTHRKDLLNQRFSRFLGEEDTDTYYLFLKKLFKSKVRHRCEARLYNEEGNPIDIQLDGIGVQESTGAGERCRITVTDISDLRQAEKERALLRERLSSAQKMEAIGTLAGGIAHDFNNLLTIINGYTELILSVKHKGDQTYSDLQNIRDTVRKGADLVRRLLDFSQKAEVSRKPVDLNLAVQNAVDLIERTFPKIIEIEASYASDLAAVSADVVRVEQILMNLCINAKEAMPDGGMIRIVTRNVLVDEDFCKNHDGARVGRFALIEITDTGGGMHPGIMSRIFDPFFTTKGWDSTKGTGLGLSVAKGIVEQHGGWITCESELGKGTRFSVYFPAVESSDIAFPAGLLKEPGNTKAKILLVDDEEPLRDLAKRFLRRAGYAVITAANGIEALEIFRREQAEIALVILDLIMPKIAGEKCLEELLSINPELKVIVSSGHSLSTHERSRLGVLAKGFAHKPYELKQLLQIVKEVMAMP